MATLAVPGVGNVPVVWKPSPDFNRGRAGFQPIAIVHHRAVASVLESIDSTLISSTRQVSAQFSIGHTRAGRLEIHQHVDLSDTAWCNGIDPAKEGLNNWTRWGYRNTNHNAQTVSIEHEDQGGSSDPAKKGVVREDILKTSIALDRLMTSGSITAIRAAGVRVRDAETVAALKRMPKDGKHLITHHDIAARSKPYCWLPWAADKTGFPRARYVRELTTAPVPAPTPGDAMPALTNYIPGQVAKIKATGNIRTAPSLTASIVRVVPAAGEIWTVIGWCKGQLDPDTGSDQWIVRWSGTAYEYTAKGNVTSVAPAPDTTPISQAKYDADLAAVKASNDAEVAALQGRITTIKGKVVASAADVADD